MSSSITSEPRGTRSAGLELAAVPRVERERLATGSTRLGESWRVRFNPGAGSSIKAAELRRFPFTFCFLPCGGISGTSAMSSSSGSTTTGVLDFLAGRRAFGIGIDPSSSSCSSSLSQLGTRDLGKTPAVTIALAKEVTDVKGAMPK